MKSKENISVDEKFCLDMDRLVDAYMRLVPNVNFSEEDIFHMSIDMHNYFNELLGQIIVEKKIESQNKNKLLNEFTKKI